jgi:hypothetical protein
MTKTNLIVDEAARGYADFIENILWKFDQMNH